MELALGVGAALIGAVLVGFFHRSLRRFILGALARPCQMAVGARDALWNWSRQTGAWIGTVRQAEGMAEPAVFLQRAIGATLYAALFTVFLLNEIHIGLLTWGPALGLAGGSLEKWLPADATGVVIATGVVGAGILWALVATDQAGKTNLAPWNKISSPRVVWAAVMINCALILAVVIALAQHRIGGLQSPSITTAAPLVDGLTETVDQVTSGNNDGATSGPPQLSRATEVSEQVMLGGHAVLMLTSAAATGWGLIGPSMIGTLLLAQLVQGALHVLGWPFAFLDLLLNWVGQALLNLYDLITRVCLLLARPIGQRFFPGVTDVDLPVGDTDPPPPATADATASADTARQPQVDESRGQPGAAGPGDDVHVTGGAVTETAPEPTAPSTNWRPY